MKRWILVALAIGLALAGSFWAVRRFRPPGAMTVLESQAMDMKAMKPPPGAAPVATETVGHSEVAESVTYTGTVVAYGDQDVVARVTGRVEDIPVYPGERVIPGQLLVRLDSAELASRVAEAEAARAESERQVQARESEWQSRLREQQAAQSAVPIARNEVQEARQMTRSSRARLEAAQARYRRTEILQREGGASLQELQQDRAELAEARAADNANRLREQRASLAVRKAQAEVDARGSEARLASSEIEAARAAAEMRAAQAQTARIQLGYTEILATAPGEVVERVVSPGTLVSPGQVLLRIKQSRQVRLQASVPAEQASRVRAGFPVTARVGSKTLHTRVASVFRSANPETRTMIVEARVAPEPELVPGAAVTMEVALEAPTSRLTVPVGALQTDAEGAAFVWKLVAAPAQGSPVYTCVMHPEVVRSAPGKCPKCGMQLVLKETSGGTTAVRQPVRPGPVSGERVVVLSGLEHGDEIIVQGYQNLTDGTPVARVAWGLNGPVELPTPAAPASPSHSGHGGHVPTGGGHGDHQ